MKTTLVLIALIFLNTSALLSEPIAQIVSGINTWVFVAIEVVLFFILFVHQSLKGLHTLSQIELKGHDFFIFKQKENSQERS